MSSTLLAALLDQEKLKKAFTFQHKLCHDLESLIWVVVYAMMIRRRNVLSATDPTQSASFQDVLDGCWGVHSYTRLWANHGTMIMSGCSAMLQLVEGLWFPEPFEAAFFRDAMRVARGQAQDGVAITYEGLCALFEKYIQLGMEAKDSVVIST
jgi:hypothetical protein